MIEESHVETFIKAKKDQLAVDILFALSVVPLTALIFLEALGITHDYAVLLATMSMVFMCGAAGQSRWVAVSRTRLGDTLEQIINSDPDALTILARKRRDGVSVNEHR